MPATVFIVHGQSKRRQASCIGAINVDRVAETASGSLGMAPQPAALLFPFFHKRLCAPLANSHFHHRAVARHQPPSKLETAYHRADKAIQQIVDLLAA
jgi:hypothetical protein